MYSVEEGRGVRQEGGKDGLGVGSCNFSKVIREGHTQKVMLG